MLAPRLTNGSWSVHLAVALFAAALLLVSPGTALAEPTADELAEQADALAGEADAIAAEREALESQLSEVNARLEELGREIASIQQELMDAEECLEITRGEIEETQASIEETQAELEERREALGLHMRGSYKMGLFGMIDTLLGSTSFEDLINRIFYLDKISEASAADIAEIERLEQELADRQAELEQIQARQQEEIEACEAKVVEYESKIAEAQEYYNDLGAEIQAKLAEEEAKRAEEEAKRAEEAEAREAEEEAKRRAEEAARQAALAAAGVQTSEDAAVAEQVAVATGSSDVVANAYTLIGRPYKTWWSGRNYGPDAPGFDCCGLAATAYHMAGYSTPYATSVPGLMNWVRSRGNWKDCNLSNIDQVLAPGDMLFCSTGHVAIYIGGGMMIHAPSPGRYVCVAPVYACIGGGFGG